MHENTNVRVANQRGPDHASNTQCDTKRLENHKSDLKIKAHRCTLEAT